MKKTNTGLSISHFIAAALLCAGAHSNADTVSWIGGSGNYNVGANWDVGEVPCIETRPLTENAVIPDTGVVVTQNVPGCTVSGLTLGAGSALSLLSGTQFDATSANLAGTVSGSGTLNTSFTDFTGTEAWVFGTSGASFTLLNAINGATDTRFTATTGSVLNIEVDRLVSTGASNSNITIVSATGSGAIVQLPTATELDASFNSIFGSTQFHQVLASDGGVIDLSGITLATGPEDDEDFLFISVTDTASINLDSLQTVTAGGYVLFDTMAGGILNLPSLQSTVDAFFSATNPGSQILANQGSWTFSSTGRPNNNSTLINSVGAGALVDLSGMTSLDASFDSIFGSAQFQQILASSGGAVDLSGVTQVAGPVDDEDFLLFSVSDTGSINLDALQTVTAGGYVNFTATAGGTLSLPSLQSTVDAFFYATTPGSQILADQSSWTFSSTERANTNSTLVSATGSGALVNLAGMTNLDAGFNSIFGSTQFHQILASSGGTVDLSGLVSMTGPLDDEDYLSVSVSDTALINLDNLQTVEAGGYVFLTAIDGASLSLPSLQTTEGAVFWIDTADSQILANASNWTFSSTGLPNSNTTLMRAAASGALIDLSGLTALDASFNSVLGSTQFHQIVAVSGGVIDLSGVTQITGPIDDEDYLRVSVSDTASINLDSLNTVSAGGFVLFEALAGATLSLPSLQSTQGAVFIADTPDSQILAGDSSWTLSSTSLPNSNATITRAAAAGALVDLSGITVFNAGFNSIFSTVQTHSVTATNGGRIDLSGVDSIIGPADSEDVLSFTANNGGTLAMGTLGSVTDNTTVVLSVGAGGTVEFPGALDADASIVVIASADSSVNVSGNLSFKHTDEAQFDLEAARVYVENVGTADIEIGSANEGIAPVTSPNFGFAQLTIGSAGTTTTARLVDVVNNGNGDACALAGIDREALYLYGLDAGPDADGLRILNGSTLTLGGFDLYAAIGGVLMHINPMLTPGVPFPYDEGFVELGTPFDYDEDGVPDGLDNCVLVPNPDQVDADNDGYGNLCDGDLNGDLFVNNLDIAGFAAAFLSMPGDPNWNPAADFDDNGAVNFLDYVIMVEMFLMPPGPACPVPAL